MDTSKTNDYMNDPSMQSFSATGRPYAPPSKQEKAGYAMNSMAVADSFGAGTPNFLPVKFTDKSLISVPVLRPEDVGKAEPQKTTKKSLFSSRRKSENTNFVTIQMPRGEYLKYYAKDDNGVYCGTEYPAPDCILRGNDVEKYRRGTVAFSNEVGGPASADGADGKKQRKSKITEDEVIR